MPRNTRGESSKLSKTQRRKLLLDLKVRAIAGDMQAAQALSNFELAEVTRNRLHLDLDRVVAV